MPTCGLMGGRSREARSMRAAKASRTAGRGRSSRPLRSAHRGARSGPAGRHAPCAAVTSLSRRSVGRVHNRHRRLVDVQRPVNRAADRPRRPGRSVPRIRAKKKGAVIAAPHFARAWMSGRGSCLDAVPIESRLSALKIETVHPRLFPHRREGSATLVAHCGVSQLAAPTVPQFRATARAGRDRHDPPKSGGDPKPLQVRGIAQGKGLLLREETAESCECVEHQHPVAR